MTIPASTPRGSGEEVEVGDAVGVEVELEVGVWLEPILSLASETA